MRPMKDRQAPVRVFMHAHRGTHEMRPERAQRDLYGQTPPLDGVVVTYPALFLDAQDLAHPAVRSPTKALPASAGATAKAALWTGQ